ncbi:MAG: amidase [Stellaceae bacterium]
MSPSLVREIAARINSRDAAAREIVEPYLARIAECNPLFNALVGFDPEEGRRAAIAVDRRVAGGERLPLAGVPVAIKDNIWVAGRRVTQGSRLFRDFIAPADAIAVARLKAAGAVIVGISNTPEFAAKGVTNNYVYGPTRHPADPRLTPGGSSGGSATAVAAGMVPLALGTDAGGSGRRPPAHVGVVGFKPSYGAIPYGPGFAEPFVGISVIAPIARSVADIAAAFAALAGPDQRDPDSILALAAEDAAPVADLRIAYSPRFGLDVPVDSDVKTAIEAAIASLAAADARIVRRDPTWPAGATENALLPLQHAALASLYGDRFRREPALFDPDIAAQIESGLAFSGTAVAGAMLLAGEIARGLAAFFGDADLIIGPTTPCVAWPNDRAGPETIGGLAVPPRGHAVFTPLFNHAKVPAISIPCGTGRDGLPVGLQIVGPRGNDRRVLRFAQFAENVLQTIPREGGTNA